MRNLLLAILLAFLGSTAAAHADAPADWQFITRRGDQLFDGDRPFRFVSFNIPNLMVIEDAYEFTKPNPWRWPDEFELEDALESVRQMGGQVVRTYVVSVLREGSDMGRTVHVLAPGEFNEEGFRAIDKLIEIARRKGIRVLIPFVDQSKWWGGIGEYAAFRGKPPEAFWSDRQIIDDFKKTIRHLIERKNVYTGVVYRDDPTILGWQTGNEINSTSGWTREIAAYIKKLDPNHLIIEGKSLHGVPVWSLDDPNIDVITTHHYPWGDDHDYVKPIRAAHALTKGKKAYFVGEFGFVETPHLADAIQAVIDDGISGALLWSLRMHRREGGFYWHMEVGTGRNIYKAYHWPGFASGDRYDEREVLRLVRDKAYEIRGQSPPELAPPAPPKLLPIDRPSAISWQGSAGAASYRVERAEQPTGPWISVADSVSDADTQYRPLFNDQEAVPGGAYYYRVVARNEAGDSEPSNVVGPVSVSCRTLVDECRDLSLADASSGQVEIATENARTVQEDCHRFALAPGASVVYRLDRPISACRVFAFSRADTAGLQIEFSTDGNAYQTADVERQAFPSSQTVYGYLTPVLFEAIPPTAAANYVRISAPGTSQGKPPVAQAPLEIGRIEIEYDRADDQAAAAPRAPSGKPAPANPAVFVYGPRFIEATLAAIDDAARRGDRRVNVVVTILVDLSDDLRIKSFGRYRGPQLRYTPYDDEMRRELRESLERVFMRMVEHNMEIFILPHIDAGGEVHAWRNWVDFDPLQPYGGRSYDDLMIDTVAEAIKAKVPDGTNVELALSGEMGTSLFRYPQAYRKIVRRLRNDPQLENVKIGFSLNHSGIAGHDNPTGAPDIQLSDDGGRELQSLIDECDFIGMSFYRPVDVRPTAADFVRGVDHFMGELKSHGLEVPTTKPLHFSEVGLGGGHEGQTVDDPALAVRTPWEGTNNLRKNPWRHQAMRELRQQYHRALLDFLSSQPAPWRVSAAFFWSMGSWDPHGFRGAEFGDPEIIEAIERHNRGLATQ